MDLISRPEAWSARIDDSRPEPGPLTLTSTVRTPCSRAAVAHACAAICAANGVPLREPLKPHRPALDQDSRLPCGSAIATTVLLNVAWTWATADGMFFFSFFFPPGFLAPGFPFVIRASLVRPRGRPASHLAPGRCGSLLLRERLLLARDRHPRALLGSCLGVR